MLSHCSHILSECAIFNSKKSRFIKEQEARGILSKLGIKTTLSEYCYWMIFCFKGIQKVFS